MAFPFTGRIEVVWLLLVQTAFSYYVVLRLRKGVPRLIALLPLFPPSLLVPWRAPTISERIIFSLHVLWIVNFKLILLAWDMGPAADPFSISTFPRFFFSIISSMHLKLSNGNVEGRKDKEPEVAKVGNLDAEGVDGIEGSSKWRYGGSFSSDETGTKSRSDALSGRLVRRKTAAADDDDGKTSELQQGRGVQSRAKTGVSVWKWVRFVASSHSGPVVLLRCIFHFTMALSILRILAAWKHLMSEYVLDLILPFYLYFGCLFLFELSAAIPACLFGIQTDAQFNMPFLADSLADFWGRRWNLLINNLLRVSVYDPVRNFLKPSPWGRVLPTLAAFLVSGLMHDVICLYGSKMWPSWELTAFFVLNGVFTIVEGFVLPPRRRSRVPRVLRRAYTLAFLYFTAYWLFFPPSIQTGLMDALEEVGRFLDWILTSILRWLR